LNKISEGVKKSWNKKEDLLNQSDEMALKADLLAYNSRYEEADQYYEKALQLNPSNANLWAFKGINLSGGLNKDIEARKAWENAKRLDPVLADAIDVKKIEKDEHEEFSSPVLCGMPDNIRDKIKQLMQKQKEQLDNCK
jgi:tetratricopeptide (TPR) repeat protein